MKDDGRIPRIKDTDMTDRLLTAGAIAEDTRNPIGDIAACFPGHGSQSVGMFHGCLSGFPEAQQVIARADDLYKERYGERLSTTVGSGRDDRLTMPTVMQPAIVTASLAMFAVLEARNTRLDAYGAQSGRIQRADRLAGGIVRGRVRGGHGPCGDHRIHPLRHAWRDGGRIAAQPP